MNRGNDILIKTTAHGKKKKNSIVDRGVSFIHNIFFFETLFITAAETTGCLFAREGQI